jgi:hypothetical protein
MRFNGIIPPLPNASGTEPMNRAHFISRLRRPSGDGVARGIAGIRRRV